MVRPLKTRRVRHDPPTVYFKPHGVPLRLLREVTLSLDELEALRLADLEELSQEEAGQRMGVSRATFGRIAARARAKVAEALVHGHAIRVEGGEVELVDDEFAPGPGRRGRGFGRGFGRGAGGRGAGRRWAVPPPAAVPGIDNEDDDGDAAAAGSEEDTRA